MNVANYLAGVYKSLLFRMKLLIFALINHHELSGSLTARWEDVYGLKSVVLLQKFRMTSFGFSMKLQQFCKLIVRAGLKIRNSFLKAVVKYFLFINKCEGNIFAAYLSKSDFILTDTAKTLQFYVQRTLKCANQRLM